MAIDMVAELMLFIPHLAKKAQGGP